MENITLRAELSNGVNSFERVLNLLRTKGVEDVDLQFKRGTLTMSLPAELANQLIANLNNMQDVKLLA